MSLSFTKSKGSVPLAYINGGDRDGGFIYLDENAVGRDVQRTRLDVASDSMLIPEPEHDASKRQLFWCAGPSGAGKGTFIKYFSIRYRALWPLRNIVLISSLASDDTLPCNVGRLNMRRVNVESLLTKELTLEELSNDGEGCLVVFDDCEGFNKQLETVVEALKAKVATQGRHFRISCIYSGHALTNFAKSRLLLSEAGYYYTFPTATSNSSLSRLLQTYGGLDTKQVAAVRRLPSRWVCERRTFPPAIIHQTGAYLAHAT